MEPTTALGGRREQAAREEAQILEAAREVFLADPEAPTDVVALRAGVPVGSLRRRYADRESLLRQVCAVGLRQYVAEAEAAVVVEDGWTALSGFLQRLVDMDVHAITIALAGTFAPTPDMREDADRASALTVELVERARESKLRPDVAAADLDFVLEACAAIHVPDPERTRVLRRRYLSIMLDGLSVPGPSLPGPGPQPEDIGWRWRR